MEVKRTAMFTSLFFLFPITIIQAILIHTSKIPLPCTTLGSVASMRDVFDIISLITSGKASMNRKHPPGGS